MDTAPVEWPAPADDRALGSMHRLLRALHPRAVNVYFPDQNDADVRVFVTDNSAALVPAAFPRAIGGARVVLRLHTSDREPVHPQTGARWNVPDADAVCANAAIAEHGAAVVAAVPTTVLLTAAHPEDRGAVDYARVVVLALVSGDAVPVDVRCGDFAVEVERLPPRWRCARIRDAPVAGYPAQASARARNMPRWHIGQSITRFNDADRIRVDFTLGCFARRQSDGAVVALTAGHCVIPADQGVALSGTVLTVDHGQDATRVRDAFVHPDNLYKFDPFEPFDWAYFPVPGAELDVRSVSEIGAPIDWRHMDKRSTNYFKDETDLRVEFTGICCDEHDPVFSSHLKERHWSVDRTPGDNDQDNPTRPVDPVFLFKFGMATRLTVGTMRKAEIFHNAGNTLHKRFSAVRWGAWPCFSDFGDSGAVVVTADGNAVGMIVAVVDTLSVIIPMHEVCRELKVELLVSQRPPDA